MAIKAVAYIRVSGQSQLNGDGPERQVLAIQHYARLNDIRITKTYTEAISGTVEGEDRPQWTAMLSRILSNGCKVIVVESLGRLSRELFVQEYILRDLKQRNIELISTQESDLGSSDPTRVMLRQIVGAVHEYEKSMLVLKLKGARQRIRASGTRCDGRKPFGYRKGETDAIQRALALRNEGLSLTAIANTLGSEGYKPRGGGKWHINTVARVVRNATAGTKATEATN